ncbi:hypothetical protein M758_6G144900 [Ceratodon purpureus]|uniref:YqgF/RNase H-like domain-containing protein n=1 Tax=Ceratodon purpureus TaxID=3225 RepID=A0A8T0HEU1_CERPU|nr:hypothetical protein KC19_6G150700 [Ceratodon purpureus]KAG0614015.1 hypothetical protein M758_6G144900 [Ceratodon purpureus]
MRGQMGTLNHVAVVPRLPSLQLGCVRFVPLRVEVRVKLQMRGIGVVCAGKRGRVEVGKGGEEVEGDGVKVQEDPKLRLELKVKVAALECNARKAKGGEGVGRLRGHTIGVDLGDVRTGLSVSLGGFAPRPLTVVRQRGDKLLETILQVALQEKADEFVVGLPKSWDGKDSEQANKCRSFAGRLSNLAARRGWRVYLHDEYGTSQDALDYMIDIGSNRRSRKEQLDAYAAKALLCNYFESGGSRAQIVVPKPLDLQQLLCQGPSMPPLSSLEDDDGFGDFDDE